MEIKKIEINLTECTYDELEGVLKQVVDEARAVTQNAYVPYSKFSVGAAILLEDGTIVRGCNQENAAYPSGTCAERVAMFYANATYPNVAPVALAIAGYYRGEFLDLPISPCGACRQVLLETEVRYGKDIQVLLCGEKKIQKLGSIKDLLPLAFNEENLK